MISNEQLIKELREVDQEIRVMDAARVPLATRRRELVTILRGRDVKDRGLSLKLGKKPNWISNTFKKDLEPLLVLRVLVSDLASELQVSVADLREWFPLDLPRGTLRITEPTADMIRDAVKGRS